MDLQIEPIREHAQDIAGSAIGAARAVAERIADATDAITADEDDSGGRSWLIWFLLALIAFAVVGGVLFKRKRSNEVALQEVVEDAATGADMPGRPAMAS